MNGNPSDIKEDGLQDAWRTAWLLARFIRKELLPEEEEELNDWKNKSETNRLLFEELTNVKNIEKAKEWFSGFEKQNEIPLSVKEKIPFIKSHEPGSGRKWLLAAAVLAIIVAGSVIFIKHKTGVGNINHERPVKAGDVAPGGNKAVLQLADGSVVALNDQQNGILRKEGDVTVRKTKDGELLYEDGNTGGTAITYHTLTTPVSGGYSVVLADGTRAWLNASSSLRYPVSFKHERIIAATGEIFFEVKKEQRPFIVRAKGTRIEVLGTRFNVNAYSLVQTTLLQGSLRLNDSTLLRPGEQAISDSETRVIKLQYPDDVIAWKNGYFRFSHEDIREIMNQLSRWYNIDVGYEGNLSSTTFTVTAARNQNLSTTLKHIEAAGDIHFKIEGRKVTVMP